MGIRITPRDISILRYVSSYRLLGSRSHILPFFGGSRHLLRRLKKLYEHGYLYRLPGRRPHEEAVYAVGNKGADLLNREHDVPRPRVDYTQQHRRLGGHFIEHTLLVADIMVAIELACQRRSDVRFISPEDILSGWAPPSTREKATRVGGRPFRWRVHFSYKSWSGRKSIEPDRMFGLVVEDGRNNPNWFFLEADRQTMPVKSRNMNRSSIFKKQLQYFQSWESSSTPNRFEELFGIPHVRTLFVLATGYEGNKRLNRCIEVNKHFSEGQGTGLFLFANKETLFAADTILTAPLISGRGAEKFLVG